jgi:hypothetical protein
VATLSGPDYELRYRIIRDIGGFTVPLFKTISKEIELAGTGMLFTDRGSHYILTAAHVWEEKLKSAVKIGIGIQEDIANRFFVERALLVPCGPPIPSVWNEWGPDMTFLRIPEGLVGSINARRVFYSPTVDGIATPANPVEVWLLMGTPAALGTFTPAHAEVQVNGRFVGGGDVGYKTRGQLDYFDVKMDTSSPGTPKDFGGVSGGGLWRVQVYCSSSTGKIDWARSLEGVAFYQLPGENGSTVIRCHGPQSIARAFSAI